MRISATAVLAGLLASTTASADTLTAGLWEGGNCYPFACFASDSATTYQMVFDGGLFGDAVTINGWQIEQDTAGGMDEASFSVAFYYAANPFGSSVTTLADNLGDLLYDWGEQEFGYENDGQMYSSYSWDISGIGGFDYDPSLGDLLMHVEVVSTGSLVGYYDSFFKADYTGTDVLRNYAGGVFGTGVNEDGALVTTFTYEPVDTAVPLPASAVLLASVVGGLGLYARRRA